MRNKTNTETLEFTVILLIIFIAVILFMSIIFYCDEKSQIKTYPKKKKKRYVQRYSNEDDQDDDNDDNKIEYVKSNNDFSWIIFISLGMIFLFLFSLNNENGEYTEVPAMILKNKIPMGCPIYN